MGGRAGGKTRGSGQSWTKSSLALQCDPVLISADFIRHCSVLSVLSSAPCVVWVRVVFVITGGAGAVPSHAGRSLWHAAFEIRKPRLSAYLTAVSSVPPSPQVGRMMDGSQTLAHFLSHVCRRAGCSLQGLMAQDLWIFDACCEWPGVKRLLLLTTRQIGPNRKKSCLSKNTVYLKIIHWTVFQRNICSNLKTDMIWSLVELWLDSWNWGIKP